MSPIDTLDPDVFPVKVEGIPALARIVHYTPYRPGRRSGHPDTWTPDEPTDLDYELHDRKGYRARWLDKFDGDDVAEQILEQLGESP